MNKNELTLETLKISADKYKVTLNFLTSAFKLIALVAIIYIIMEGLREIAGANPAAIKALAGLVKELKISTITGYVLAAFCGSGWYMERKGKKRLLRKKAAERHRLEQNDPYNPACGLTPTGDTPTSEGN
ncbi:hypothetical protein GJ699_07480 [Duganella sp. FT80W]|uniref:Uncharacterized protein n=1 Tax=Duganella guangzhouensis TaxID=2666084 RepID=A0A6I2KWA8_9BURK|nr:hypothetical protein [Duganella guangzhouensis]MRW89820.1 hypothetical protein [Duganella guangzhouensis]